MKVQSFDGVCNGFHLWNFSKGGQLYNAPAAKEASFSLGELAERMTGDTKAILIVDGLTQPEIVEQLESLQNGVALDKLLQGTSLYAAHTQHGEKHLAIVMRNWSTFKLLAKKLSHWSARADLWMVRKVAVDAGWEWELEDDEEEEDLE